MKWSFMCIWVWEYRLIRYFDCMTCGKHFSDFWGSLAPFKDSVYLKSALFSSTEFNSAKLRSIVLSAILKILQNMKCALPKPISSCVTLPHKLTNIFYTSNTIFSSFFTFFMCHITDIRYSIQNRCLKSLKRHHTLHHYLWCHSNNNNNSLQPI